jgi:hypothetical protein
MNQACSRRKNQFKIIFAVLLPDRLRMTSVSACMAVWFYEKQEFSN